jgi:hypothetical protein
MSKKVNVQIKHNNRVFSISGDAQLLVSSDGVPSVEDAKNGSLIMPAIFIHTDSAESCAWMLFALMRALAKRYPQSLAMAMALDLTLPEFEMQFNEERINHKESSND